MIMPTQLVNELMFKMFYTKALVSNVSISVLEIEGTVSALVALVAVAALPFKEPITLGVFAIT